MFNNFIFRKPRHPLIQRMNRHLNMAAINRVVDVAAAESMDIVPNWPKFHETPSFHQDTDQGFIRQPSPDMSSGSSLTSLPISDALHSGHIGASKSRLQSKHKSEDHVLTTKEPALQRR